MTCQQRVFVFAPDPSTSLPDVQDVGVLSQTRVQSRVLAMIMPLSDGHPNYFFVICYDPDQKVATLNKKETARALMLTCFCH